MIAAEIAPESLCNIDAEATLLGALMIENTLIERIADRVLPADFFEPLHGRIFSAIMAQDAKGQPATPPLLKGYFDHDSALNELGGPRYLARLTADGQGLMSPVALANVVADLSRRRVMREGLRAAITACEAAQGPIAEAVSLADAAIADRADDGIHQPTGGECFDELLASFDDPVTGVECRMIPSLDGLVGAIMPKQLVILAARPGMGKTAVALSYALGAARNGFGVLFVSLEMSSRELATRMAADLSFHNGRGIPFHAIRDRTLNADDKRRVADIGQKVHSLPLHVIDAGSVTIGRLNALVRRHGRRMAAKGQKLDLVVVDYLQLVHPDNKGRSQYEAVSEVSRGLKVLAKDHGVGVMALAQLSRSVESRPDKRPQLSDLRDSGQIEQDADAVLFLLRNEYYLRQAEPDELAPERAKWEAAMEDCRGQIEFILAKRRNGTTGSAFGEFHGAYQAVRG